MAEFCKITETNQAMDMPNPYRMVVANPTEEQKRMIADVDGWLEKQYTEAPEYDPETQYVTDYWEQSGTYAVQHWESHEIVVDETSDEP